LEGSTTSSASTPDPSGRTSRWLTTKEAARYLAVGTNQLRVWRVCGLGPAFARFGLWDARFAGVKIRYRRESLDLWTSKHRSGRNRVE